MTTDRYARLFEPIRIGPKTMRNRFYKTPHCTSFGSERPGTQAYFRATAAEGGWAAVNTEVCSIHPSCDDVPYIMARLWDKNDIANFRLMTERVHEHDSLAGVQLWYGSAHTANLETRQPARGVSQVACEWGVLQSCYELDKAEIRELQQLHVTAAIRAREAGFDIVNVYGGHGGPITYQFLDPFWNKRADEYGGTFANRARFWRETIELVKEAVGDVCTIAARISLDSLRPDGLTVDDTIQFVALVDHLVDLWDFQLGAVNSEWGEDSLASRFAQENYERPWIEQVRPHTKKPIVGVGRFVSPDIMLEMVESGTLDIIGSARGSIADPFLPAKIADGRLEDIRECIGCNVCVSRVNRVAPLICTQNATAGEEYRRGWHPERFAKAGNAEKDVLIIGAGPAGLECATVLGKRGMRRIHIVEQESEIGGSLRWITQLPGLGEWSRVVNYRKIQIEKLRNVETMVSTQLTTPDITAYGAEIVIVATGAHWARDGLNGPTHSAIDGADASKEYVFTPEQIMVDGKSVAGDRIVIYDCDGYFVGVGLAERLAHEGKEVIYITPYNLVAPYTFYTMEGPRINRALRKLGLTLVTDHLVTEVRTDGVGGCHVFDVDTPVSWQADGVVLVTQRLSNDALYRELKTDEATLQDNGIEALYRIGDCVAPGLLADAIFSGHRLGREIDSPHPAEPLPFIRENRVIGATDADYDNVLTWTEPSARPVSRIR